MIWRNIELKYGTIVDLEKALKRHKEEDDKMLKKRLRKRR